MTSSWSENGFSPSHSLELAREAEKYRNGTIELHHVPVGQAADASPKFCFGDRVTLSAIMRDGARRPFASLGPTAMRNNGKSAGSVVKGQTVTETSKSNVLSWRITTGRGL